MSLGGPAGDAPLRVVLVDDHDAMRDAFRTILETAGMVIDVSDTLVVVGNPAEPIVIRPNLNNLTCGDDRGWWQGINVANNISDPGYLEMDNAHIWYGQWGVRLREQGTAVIRNSELRCSGNNGVLHEGSGVLLIDNTPIVDNDGARTAPAEKSGPVHLVVGTHILTVDYLQTSGNVALQVFCKKANDAEKICPTQL